MLRSLFLLLIFYGLSACSDNSHEEFIFQKWLLVEQQGEGALTEDQLNIDQIVLHLKDEYSYTYNSMGVYEETGSFSVESSRLYTFPREEQPRYFTIESLTADSLILLMQEEGRDMIWKFIPEK